MVIVIYERERVQGLELAHRACCPLIICERGGAGSKGFIRFKGGRWRLRRDPSAQVAAVLAFVISSATFLAAQDDDTGGSGWALIWEICCVFWN